MASQTEQIGAHKSVPQRISEQDQIKMQSQVGKCCCPFCGNKLVECTMEYYIDKQPPHKATYIHVVTTEVVLLMSKCKKNCQGKKRKK